MKAILRKPLFTVPSVPVLDLLLQMRQARMHMALVVDEYGGIDGLVTIEDLVETITGDISDEHDEDGPPQMVEKPDGTIELDARMPVEAFEARMGAGADRRGTRRRYRHHGRAGLHPGGPRAGQGRAGLAFLRPGIPGAGCRPAPHPPAAGAPAGRAQAASRSRRRSREPLRGSRFTVQAKREGPRCRSRASRRAAARARCRGGPRRCGRISRSSRARPPRPGRCVARARARAIAAHFGVPVEEVEKALVQMRSPRPESTRGTLNVTLAAHRFVMAERQGEEPLWQTMDRIFDELIRLRQVVAKGLGRSAEAAAGGGAAGRHAARPAAGAAGALRRGFRRSRWDGSLPRRAGPPAGKEPFDIDEVFRRLREAVAELPKAAMFDLRDRGYGSPVRAARRQPDLGPDPRRDDAGRLPPPVRRGPDARRHGRAGRGRAGRRCCTGATFPEPKARDLLALSRQIVEEHGGRCPTRWRG